MSTASIDEKLRIAQRALWEAGNEAEELGIELQFMGMVFEPKFGWFTPNGELQLESDWNDSACVIGSSYAEGYGMEGWKSIEQKDFGNRGR